MALLLIGGVALSPAAASGPDPDAALVSAVSRCSPQEVAASLMRGHTPTPWIRSHWRSCRWHRRHRPGEEARPVDAVLRGVLWGALGLPWESGSKAVT